jgi:hypothetical protein
VRVALRRRFSLFLGSLFLAVPFPALAGESPGALRAEQKRLLAEAEQTLGEEAAAPALAVLKALLKVVPNHPSYLRAIALHGARHDDPEAVLFGLRHMALSGLAWPPEDPLGPIVEDGEVKRALILASANRMPKGKAETWATLPDPSFLLEGLAPGERPDEFYAGDLARPVIYRANTDGEAAVWKTLPGGPPLGVFGLERHPRRPRLLASLSRAVPGDATGSAAVVVLSLPDGAVIERREVPPALGPTLLGEAVFGPGETIFASDSHGGRLLVSPGEGVPFRLLGAAHWTSPQGLAWDAKRQCLFVADYALGIFRCDPESGEAVRLAAPPTSCLVGIDGLELYRGGLVAVQNATLPQRVLWLSLDPPGRRVTTEIPVLSGDRRLLDPTLGFIRDDHFHFVARSPWPFLIDDRFERPKDERTLLLRLSLLFSHE